MVCRDTYFDYRILFRLLPQVRIKTHSPASDARGICHTLTSDSELSLIIHRSTLIEKEMEKIADYRYAREFTQIAGN